MTAERLPADEFDDRLTEALRRAALPAGPTNLAGRVRGQVRRQRRVRILGTLAAAAGLMLGAIGLLSLQPAGAPRAEVKLAEQNGIKELRQLLGVVPVVSVTAEQDAWLAALDQELRIRPVDVKEDKR